MYLIGNPKEMSKRLKKNKAKKDKELEREEKDEHNDK